MTGSLNPILILVGERDDTLEEIMRQTLRPLYPNAELAVLPACGHYPIFETPAALATAIDDFLGGSADTPG